MATEAILVVDDNPTNLKLLRVLLVGEGYEVKTAVNGEEALSLLKSFQPRLVLMDLQLPGINGLALTQMIKADPKTKDIVIIAVTAYAMKGDDQKAFDAGCDGYIAKPIDTRTLPSIVAQYLAGPASPATV